jgi:hypothetical protein
VPLFHGARDPDRPGQLLLDGGKPVATVYWAHDFAERSQTGWFLALLDGAEPDGGGPRPLTVSDDITALVRDRGLDRAAWLARAEALELVTAAPALAAGERELARIRGGRPA